MPLTFSHTYIHAHVHTHTSIHIYIHTYIYTCIHTYMHTYTHAYIHTCMHTNTHIYMLQLLTNFVIANYVIFFLLFFLFFFFCMAIVGVWVIWQLWRCEPHGTNSETNSITPPHVHVKQCHSALQCIYIIYNICTFLYMYMYILCVWTKESWHYHLWSQLLMHV